MTTDNAPINVKAAFVTILILVGCGVGFTMLRSLGGPFSRCEGYGGHMFVGPGGETTCLNARTFLPIDGFDSSSR